MWQGAQKYQFAKSQEKPHKTVNFQVQCGRAILNGKTAPWRLGHPPILFPLPSAMAIMAIWPFLAVMVHMAMADSKTNMAIMGIQWKSMEKLTQQSWFQLSSTFHSKVMAIWSFVLGAYIVTYTISQSWSAFTDTRNTWPRWKIKGVLESDKGREQFGRV